MPKAKAAAAPIAMNLDDVDDVRTENISVVVRIRPLTTSEQQADQPICVEPGEDGKAVQVCGKLPSKDKEVARAYPFTLCLGGNVSQAHIFDAAGVKGLLTSALDGYSTTIFAYGQTGSGKTHTIVGSESVQDRLHERSSDQDGIISRSMKFLFKEIDKRRDFEYKVRVSYLEIYNEQARDLLVGNGEQLQVKYDVQRAAFVVPTLSWVACENKKDAVKAFSQGFRRTRVASHDMNTRSNRSHCIFAVELQCKEVGGKNNRHGKISFVDLAGSERIKHTNTSGATLRESGQINKSLFTLGKVISVLSENKPSKFVPYRDSKLTMLLMDSIGGGAKTLMLACCSPAERHIYESLRTLEFSSRAKNIRNKPVVRLDPKESLIMELKREIKKLRMQNRELQDAVVSSLNTLDDENDGDYAREAESRHRRKRRGGGGHEYGDDAWSDDGGRNSPVRKGGAVRGNTRGDRGSKTIPSDAGRGGDWEQDIEGDMPKDLISRTQLFIDRYTDDTQDAHERLLLEELKALVSEYSTQRPAGLGLGMGAGPRHSSPTRGAGMGMGMQPRASSSSRHASASGHHAYGGNPSIPVQMRSPTHHQLGTGGPGGHGMSMSMPSFPEDHPQHYQQQQAFAVPGAFNPSSYGGGAGDGAYGSAPMMGNTVRHSLATPVPEPVDLGYAQVWKREQTAYLPSAAGSGNPHPHADPRHQARGVLASSHSLPAAATLEAIGNTSPAMPVRFGGTQGVDPKRPSTIQVGDIHGMPHDDEGEAWEDDAADAQAEMAELERELARESSTRLFPRIGGNGNNRGAAVNSPTPHSKQAAWGASGGNGGGRGHGHGHARHGTGGKGDDKDMWRKRVDKAEAAIRMHMADMSTWIAKS